MFKRIFHEATITCDVCPRTPYEFPSSVENLFMAGWVRFYLEHRQIDICPNCLFILLSDGLNPSIYTTEYKTKQAFNELRWRIKQENNQ